MTLRPALALLAPFALLAATASCVPAPDPAAAPAAPAPAPKPPLPLVTDGANPGFLLMTERATPEQREAARALIMGAFGRLGIAAVEEPYTTTITRRGEERQFTGANVVGTLPATELSTRHIVLAAHYDTVPGSPGVDDNGSGVHIVLAVAGQLAAMERRTATVHFVMLDQEEMGLVGARMNAERWKAGEVPLESMHNIDMIGWDSDDDGVIEFDSNSPEITALYQEMTVGLPVSLLVTTYPNTDHEAYRRQGFTVASISEEFEDNSQNPAYHTPADTAVQPGYLNASMQLMVRVFERLVS